MIREIADLVPDRYFHLVADGAYAPELSTTLSKRSWTMVEVEVRGRTTTSLIHARVVLRYQVNKTALVRLVIHRDPGGP